MRNRTDSSDCQGTLYAVATIANSACSPFESAYPEETPCRNGADFSIARLMLAVSKAIRGRRGPLRPGQRPSRYRDDNTSSRHPRSPKHLGVCAREGGVVN